MNLRRKENRREKEGFSGEKRGSVGRGEMCEAAGGTEKTEAVVQHRHSIAAAAQTHHAPS
jgi:hypothetical protein